MTKQEKFLWIVQTVILSNGINLANDSDTNTLYRHEFSATGVFGTCCDALRASELIPENITAEEAADDFISYMLSNLREMEEKAHGGERMECPRWFLRRAENKFR